MTNPQEQKAINKTEVVAHQINNLVKDAKGRMCHCLVCQPDVPDGEIQVLHHIKAGLCPDGTFRATSKCGAEISLQIDLYGDLVLAVKDEALSAPFHLLWTLRSLK